MFQILKTKILLCGMQLKQEKHIHIINTKQQVIIIVCQIFVLAFGRGQMTVAQDHINHHKHGIQVPQGTWHTIIVSEPCIIFESKDGAYHPLNSDDVQVSVK